MMRMTSFRSGRARAAALGAIVVAVALPVLRGCTNGGRLEEETRRSKVIGDEPGAEGDFRAFVAEHYALPRAFPSNDLANVRRKGAALSLTAIRSALGLQHFGAQWLNSPTPATCTPSCGEGNECFQGQC